LTRKKINAFDFININFRKCKVTHNESTEIRGYPGFQGMGMAGRKDYKGKRTFWG
jgi:hypothetical protein